MSNQMEGHAGRPNPPEGAGVAGRNLAELSAEELAREMEEALAGMSEEDYDAQLIQAYLDELDRKAPCPELPDADAALARFQQTIRQALPAQAPVRQQPARRVLRTALAAAVAVVLLLGGMVAAQAAGIDVFRAAAQWTEETFRFSVPDEAGGAWFEDYRDELSAAEVSEDLLPTWIPEGYEVTDIQIQELNRGGDIYILYSGKDGSNFDFLISVYDDPKTMELTSFEKDDTPVQTIQVNGKTVYLFENMGSQSAVCQHQNIIYSFVGDFSQEVIENIFASIGG